MKVCSRFLLGFLIVFVAACGMNEQPGGFRIISYTFDFNNSGNDWVAGFSDYPSTPDTAASFDLKFERTDLPDKSAKAVMQSGNNHSDDLFMYMKRKLTGLDANKQYTMTFEVEFASDAKEGSAGAGGSPGDNVYLKVGATPIEPNTVVESDAYVMNIDKGNQSKSGKDMIVIGNIAVPANSTGFVIANRSNAPVTSNIYSTPVVASTNSSGELWLIVGTDSGYEGVTTIYYTKITAVLSRLK
jgi:hypothetical protein